MMTWPEKWERDEVLRLGAFFARLVAGILFFYAGISKIPDPGNFARAIYSYDLLPDQLINLTAIVLPWLEVVAGGCLVLGKKIRASAWILLALTLIFMVAISVNLLIGKNFDCGCFGGSAAAGWDLVFRDAGLAALLLGTLFYEGSSSVSS